MLREHRGDGHIAVLVARGIRPAEAHLLKSGAGDSDEPTLKTQRGFPDEDWAAARAGLVDRGLLDPDGRLTARGTAEHRRSRRRPTPPPSSRGTLSAPPPPPARRPARPRRPAVVATGLLPQPNPVGMVWAR